MTKEDKELLLKDLCARLPYGVMLSTPNGNKALLALVFDKKYNTIVEYNDYHGNENDISEWEGGDIEFVRPYLRPMSSMTEEERIKFSKLLVIRYCEEDWEGHISTSYCIEIDNVYTDDANGIKYPSPFSMDAIDWLNTHHFDYRIIYDEDKKKYMSMIEKGLAIEVTEENNPYKE